MASAYSETGTAVACIFFLVTVWVSSALRVYVRVSYGKGPFLDDLLAVLAAILFTVYTIIFIYYQINSITPFAVPAKPTGGQSQAPLPPSHEREVTHRNLFICDLLYTFGTYTIKLSFTVMLLRLVQTRRQFWVLAVTIISGAILTVASIIHDLLFCRPIEYQWTRFGHPDAKGHCDAFWTRAVITLIHGAWVMLADITLGIIVPLMLLWNIRMHPRTKLSIRLLLGLGSLASIATIIRLAYLGLATDPTVTWAIVPMAFWSIIEQGVSITCIAIATLKPLFVRIGVVDPRDQSPVRLPTTDVFGQVDVENMAMQDSMNSGSNGAQSGASAGGSLGSGQWSAGGNGTATLLAGKRGWREKVRVKVRSMSGGRRNGNGNRIP
ncbi:hypothetical protein BJX68DRAFT_270843 [Aspergillus pseudodeflectus]|uniref:Rhodopsin domain-containing protein n=1 Tax=Aspergillus pseudodeflectus TaxID=176178 RepID=A0ABR4JQ16_9EURO